MTMENRPYALTVAGFDPSGGAGILADIKTFEMLGVYGLAAVTANTYQNDREFLSVDWVPVKKILQQLTILLGRFPVKHAKIGLIRDFSTLGTLVRFLKNNNPQMRIIWDPILKSSSGFEFTIGQHSFQKRNARNLALITPNWLEAQSLWPGFENRITELGTLCPVLLKGGHRTDKPGTDQLITALQATEFPGRPFGGKSKHGSGCVFSAAATAHLALGASLEEACAKAKAYTETFILSNDTLLGYHYHHEKKD